jgi:hypothetical protein
MQGREPSATSVFCCSPLNSFRDWILIRPGKGHSVIESLQLQPTLNWSYSCIILPPENVSQSIFVTE